LGNTIKVGQFIKLTKLSAKAHFLAKITLMLRLILLCLISLPALASEYHCQVRTVRMELKLAGMVSTLLIQEIPSRNILFNEMVSDISDNGFITDLFFSTYQRQDFIVTFKSKDLKDEVTKLTGTARGSFGYGYYNHDVIHCLKR
jgi:hypothetical protein